MISIVIISLPIKSEHKVTTLHSPPGFYKIAEKSIHVGTYDMTKPSRPIRSQEILTNQITAFHLLGHGRDISKDRPGVIHGLAIGRPIENLV